MFTRNYSNTTVFFLLARMHFFFSQSLSFLYVHFSSMKYVYTTSYYAEIVLWIHKTKRNNNKRKKNAQHSAVDEPTQCFHCVQTNLFFSACCCFQQSLVSNPIEIHIVYVLSAQYEHFMCVVAVPCTYSEQIYAYIQHQPRILSQRYRIV